MNVLLQELKGLDPDRFHQLIYCILQERHPDSEIKQVAGKGGDKGVDTFRGQLADAPTIWQSKFFPDGVKKPQKKQIKASLIRALRNYRPKQWILSIPVELDIGAHEWFERLKRDYSATVRIGSFGGTRIALELMHLHTIRKTFFPNAVLDVQALRELALGTGAYSVDELASLTEHNLDSYIDRLKERDPRFYYEVRFFREGSDVEERLKRVRGAILSVTEGSRQINVYPRDIEALKLDPPKFRVKLAASAREKYERMLTKGFAAEFTRDEVLHFASSFDRLFPHTGKGAIRLDPPDTVASRRLRLRVTLSSAASSVEFPLIEFRAARVGTEEAELIGESRRHGLRLSIVAAREPQFTLTYSPAGRSVRDLLRTVDALTIVKKGASLELFDLEEERILLSGTLNAEEPNQSFEPIQEFTHSVAEIASAFGVDLKFPEEPSEQDEDSMELLLRIIRDGRIEKSGDSATANLIKDIAFETDVLAQIGKRIAVHLDNEHLVPMPVLFGVPINTGPCSVLISAAEVADGEEFRRAYIAAAQGEPVPMRFWIKSPVVITFARFPASAPRD